MSAAEITHRSLKSHSRTQPMFTPAVLLPPLALMHPLKSGQIKLPRKQGPSKGTQLIVCYHVILHLQIYGGSSGKYSDVTPPTSSKKLGAAASGAWGGTNASGLGRVCRCACGAAAHAKFAQHKRAQHGALHNIITFLCEVVWGVAVCWRR